MTKFISGEASSGRKSGQVQKHRAHLNCSVSVLCMCNIRSPHFSSRPRAGLSCRRIMLQNALSAALRSSAGAAFACWRACNIAEQVSTHSVIPQAIAYVAVSTQYVLTVPDC